MGKNKTPLICGLRENSATFYTFGSAIEDIGLNINERNNKVVLSNYVTLNLPKISIDGSENSLDLTKIADSSVNLDALDINSYLPDSIQNYVLNFETVLRNQGNYDYSLSSTVTERVFWKWLQKSGAINFQPTDSSNNFYCEDYTDPENCVIKGFGQITTSSQSSNSYNINNETYIMIPSSYGQMKYLMKPMVDNNYILGFNYTKTSEYGHVLEGLNNTDIVKHPFRYAYYDDQEAGTYTPETNKDCLIFDFSLSELKKHFNDDTLTYDKLAIDSSYFLSSEYDFNTILVYYTIYDSVGNNIATNLFGMMVLNSASEVEPNVASNIIIPSYKKKKSTTNSFGSSYSFRLNIQTASIYDDTTDTIYDYSTAESATLTDFNGAISNLNTAVSILKNNAVVLANMQTTNQSIKDLSIKTTDKVNTLEQSVNDILNGNVRNISAQNLYTNYMKPSTYFGETNNDSSYNYGKLDGSLFEYKNIKADSISADSMTTEEMYIQSIHALNNEPFDLYVGENRVIRADVNGNVFINGYDPYKTSVVNKGTAAERDAYDASIGDMWVTTDTDVYTLYIFNGISWEELNPSTISIIYADLFDLWESGKLQAGKQYLITDYQTTYIMPFTDEVILCPVEPLMVTAISNNTIAPIAYSPSYPNDVIYYEIDCEKVYHIGSGGTTSGLGTLSEKMQPGATRGFIYRRVDTVNQIDIGYDFRNVKFRRWKIDATTIPLYNDTSSYIIGDVVKYNNNIYVTLKNIDNPGSIAGNSAFFEMVSTDAYSLFKPINCKLSITQNTAFTGADVDGGYMDFSPFSKSPNDGRLQELFNVKVAVNKSDIINRANSVIISQGLIYNVSMGINCYSNTIGMNPNYSHISDISIVSMYTNFINQGMYKTNIKLMNDVFVQVSVSDTNIEEISMSNFKSISSSNIDGIYNSNFLGLINSNIRSINTSNVFVDITSAKFYSFIRNCVFNLCSDYTIVNTDITDLTPTFFAGTIENIEGTPKSITYNNSGIVITPIV